MSFNCFSRAFLALVLVSSVSLVACGKNNDGMDYISRDLQECAQIEYTCPQFQKTFADERGCGCQSTDEPDNPNERTLNKLVQRYANQQVISTKNRDDGVLLVEVVFLDNEEVSEDEVNYNAWIVAQGFHGEDGVLVKEDVSNIPAVMRITQTGLNYIIHAHATPPIEDEIAVREVFTQHAADWILAEDSTARDRMVKEIQKDMRIKAALLLNVLPDDTSIEPPEDVSADGDVSLEDVFPVKLEEDNAEVGDVPAEADENIEATEETADPLGKQEAE